ncbi:type II toxin-antitoxin system RelE/ParE family toxin [Psychrobacter sanguinis]|uniref:type II toxin-antitoxin system RelE/ParE family toxin n=1 Tax=Psychrobacter sanguinis TaxID=861445 RepID=UPI0019197F63|nr:type II toxin-antitoxin system RelE/ParE family toxin [Psychrobacter sanguinis]MCC3346499.1 type II toxin-antitoxin system RelE/ParE family toxin [Psychrobacter sanguinis]
MWTVITTDLFNDWLYKQDQSTQEKVLAALVVLQQQGPSLGRPLVDTVYDSKFTNMKELRVQHRGTPLRAFFAFDLKRQAIVLCIGDKGNNKRFYKEMLATADQQYECHLKTLGDL